MFKRMRDRLFLLSLGIATNPLVYALKKNKLDAADTGTNLDGNSGGDPVGGVGKMLEYLKYGLWAMSALGIISVGFMMFFNVQETILKNVMKVVGVICIVALGFSAPGWFGLNIIL